MDIEEEEQLLQLLLDDDEEDFLIACLLGNIENSSEKKWGGSVIGRRLNFPCDHQPGHDRNWGDCFVERPVYDERKFRQHVRMHKPYFQQRPDATG